MLFSSENSWIGRYVGLMRTYEVVYKDTLTLAVEQTDGSYYAFGTLTYTIQSDGRHVYIFDIDPGRYDTAVELSGDSMFPGFEKDNGWIQRHDKEIPFIYERTYNAKRCDLEEVLKPWGLTRETYSKWELLKRTNGAHIRDKWRVIVK